jgi:hypothetical protein
VRDRIQREDMQPRGPRPRLTHDSPRTRA